MLSPPLPPLWPQPPKLCGEDCFGSGAFGADAVQQLPGRRHSGDGQGVLGHPPGLTCIDVTATVRDTMKLLLALLLTIATASAQSKFAGDYVGIASPVKWTNLERAVVSVLVFTDGSFILEVANYDLEFFDDNLFMGWVDAKGRFIGLAQSGMLWKGTVSASGGTVKGTASDSTGIYTFSCLRRFRAAHAPWQQFTAP